MRPIPPLLLPVHPFAPLPFKERLEHPRPVPVNPLVPPLRLRPVYPVSSLPVAYGRTLPWGLTRVLVRPFALHFVVRGRAERVFALKRMDVYAGRAVPRRTVWLVAPFKDRRNFSPQLVLLLRLFRVLVLPNPYFALSKKILLFTFLPFGLPPPHQLALRTTVAVYVLPYFARVVPFTRLLRRQLYPKGYAAPFAQRNAKPVLRILVPPLVVRGFLVERRPFRLNATPPKLPLQVLPFRLAPLLVGTARLA